MHDFSVSQQIAGEVIRRARIEGAQQVLEIKIKLGELTHLNPEQITFWLEEFFRGTFARGAKILIEKIPVSMYCKKCGYRGEIKQKTSSLYFFAFLRCPQCGSDDVNINSGKECMLQRITIRK